MATGQTMLKRAQKHIGEAYENVVVPKDNPNWHGPWDCAEFMSWLVYQEIHEVYGCIDDTSPPGIADAYTGGWQKDSSLLGTRISVEQAASTVGGIVLRFPPAPGTMGHIAICDGRGGTVEAKGKKYGVVADTVQGRGWDTGVVVPSIHYDPPVTTLRWNRPEKIYSLTAERMRKETVMEIQEALARRGFDPGPIDGVYGFDTVAAVAAFQRVNGLVFDGQVGRETALELSINLL